jgi:hypothetical protein
MYQQFGADQTGNGKRLDRINDYKGLFPVRGYKARFVTSERS